MSSRGAGRKGQRRKVHKACVAAGRPGTNMYKWWGGGQKRLTLTDVVYGVLVREVLCYAGEHVYGVFLQEELATQVRIVAHKHARIHFPSEQVLPGVIEQRLRQTLESQPLVDITKFFCLLNLSARAHIQIEAHVPHVYQLL